MDSLTYDLIQYLTCFLRLPDILKLGSSSTTLHRLIIEDESFWQVKSKDRYDITEKTDTWKNTFVNNYMSIITFGSNTYGQLGKTPCDCCEPALLPGYKFKDIAVDGITLAIDFNNNVWLFSSNVNRKFSLRSSTEEHIEPPLPMFPL